MNLEDTNAADAAHSVKGQDADGTGKPADSPEAGLTAGDPDSLDTPLDNVSGSPGADSALPSRQDRPAAQNHTPAAAEETRRDIRGKKAASEEQEERRNTVDQPDRDPRSMLPPREEARRQL